MLKKIKILSILFIFYILFSAISYGSITDTDWDWVLDEDEHPNCKNIIGESTNNWCPILEETCLANSEKNTCKSWFVCNSKWFCEVEKPKELVWSCIYPKNWSSIFWNVICDSCPCDYTISFLAVLRKCDVIIPAIVSPDKNEIYWKWKPYQIPYK